MYRFNFPPYEIYPHLVDLTKANPVSEPVDLASPIGQALKRVADAAGTNAQAEILYFPMQFEGAYTLPPKPNQHVYQILGSCKVGEWSATAGDMVGLESSDINVIKTPHAPCVLAYVGFEQLVETRRSVVLDPESTELVKQILIVDHVAPEICARIIESLDTSEGEYGRVLVDPDSNKTETQLEHRKARMMKSTDPKLVQQVLREMIVEQVEPFFGTTIEFWNSPVLMKYDTGGFFLPHVDGENYRNGVWSRIYDRDYTLVCFLNDDYEGGELSFPDLNFSIKPKAGRVAAFPGSHRFRHGAEKTTAGIRYQLVSWLTAYGTERTNTPPVLHKVYRTW